MTFFPIRYRVHRYGQSKALFKINVILKISVALCIALGGCNVTTPARDLEVTSATDTSAEIRDDTAQKSAANIAIK